MFHNARFHSAINLYICSSLYDDRVSIKTPSLASLLIVKLMMTGHILDFRDYLNISLF